MGGLWDKYNALKTRTKGIREAASDVSKIAYDVSKDNPYAKQTRRAIRKG